MAATRVFLVDDLRDDSPRLMGDLTAAGYAVTHAPDAADALDRLRHDGADVVVIDLVTPPVDHWDLLIDIDADEHLAVPVVVVVPETAEKDAIRARLSGAARCVSDPVEPESLVTAVHDVLAAATDLRDRRRSEVPRLLQRLAELETGRSRSSTHVNLSRLERLVPQGPTTSVDPARLNRLTVREREVAALFAAGIGARRVAGHIGSSRANVYATRKRISRKLGVTTDLVADTARALGLADEAPVVRDHVTA